MFRRPARRPAGWKTGLGEGGLDELAGAAVGRVVVARIAGGVEGTDADRCIELADRVTAMLGPGSGGHAQQPQAGGVAGFVAGGEVAAVVDVGVDHALAR